MARDGDPRGRFIPIGGGGRFDPVGDDEAAALGHALLAQLRGEPLSPSEKALLARSRSREHEDARAPTPVVDVSETLATFERGADAELRVTWRSYKGSSPFLDIRRWERVPGDGMRPTRQGITLRVRELSRVMTVLVQALQRLGVSPAQGADSRLAEDRDGYARDGYGRDGYGRDAYGRDGYGRDRDDDDQDGRDHSGDRDDDGEDE